MPKLGYKPKKSKDGVEPVFTNDDDNTPRFSIRGKNIELAELSDITEVGETLTAEVTLEVVSISKSDAKSDYGNEITFKVKEFYKEGSEKSEKPKSKTKAKAEEAEEEDETDEDAEDTEDDQEDFQKRVFGTSFKKKPKAPSAKEALGKNY
jgi:hypothetical protein